MNWINNRYHPWLLRISNRAFEGLLERYPSELEPVYLRILRDQFSIDSEHAVERGGIFGSLALLAVWLSTLAGMLVVAPLRNRAIPSLAKVLMRAVLLWVLTLVARVFGRTFEAALQLLRLLVKHCGRPGRRLPLMFAAAVTLTLLPLNGIVDTASSPASSRQGASGETQPAPPQAAAVTAIPPMAPSASWEPEHGAAYGAAQTSPWTGQPASADEGPQASDAPPPTPDATVQALAPEDAAPSAPAGDRSATPPSGEPAGGAAPAPRPAQLTVTPLIGTPITRPATAPATPVSGPPTVAATPVEASGLTAVPTATPSPSVTPTEVVSPSVTPTEVISPSVTPTTMPGSIITPSPSVTPTATPIPSVTSSPSATATETPSPSVTPTATPSPSVTPTATPSPSVTPTPCVAQRLPLNVMLALDRSASIAEDNALDDVKQTAIGFLGQMNWQFDHAGLVTFNSAATLDQGLTADSRQLEAAVAAIVAEGGTNIAAAIRLAAEELAAAPITTARPVIVLLTDGQAKDAEAEVLDAARAAHALGIRVITIGLGATNGALLAEIASSPADYHHAPTTVDLPRIYSSIAGELNCVAEG